MAQDHTGDYAQRVDVREIDGEPFDDITAAVSDLEDGETLLLIAPFEPVPLYSVLEQRGMAHETMEVGPEEFHVEITHA